MSSVKRSLIGGLIVLLLATPALAVEYPVNSTGRLLYGYGESFSGGYITGFLEAFFMTGGVCPLDVSANMLRAALQMNVQSGKIALTDQDQLGLTRTLSALGCTHPAGTKTSKGDA